MIKLPSLELRWLNKSSKDLSLPNIVVGKEEAAGGLYYEPWKGEQNILGQMLDTSKGLIVVSTINLDRGVSFESILAHEWRHHWQRFNQSIYYDCPRASSSGKDYESYREYIVTYFTTSKCEYDALLFEVLRAPNDFNCERFEWVQKALGQ